jgi:hypothetical protein
VDLQLAIRVLWRFRLLVIPGLVLAATLAFLSMVRINVSGSPHFTYRAQPQYESTTSVFVTTHGFPWGSLNLHAGPNDPNAPRGSVDTGVLRNFASLYLTLATSGPVMKRLAQTGPINGVITAYPILAPDSTTLPLLGLSSVAATPGGALTLAKRHLAAFQEWLKTSQVKAGTDPDQRIVLEPVTGPLPATLLMGRKKTKPIMIFLAMSVAVIGLAFVLENLRPRIRTVPEQQAAEHQLSDAQTTTRLTA